tara:strand:+ start:43 stop:228 length:186 start_codon:yes stop_codon:yes gene_type:complete
MRYLLISLIFLLLSCGYPDIDNVPDFKNLELSEDEILDYCSSINTSKKNIENCIKDYNSKK